MKLLISTLASAVLLAVGAFCLFGFLATFEPTDQATRFLAFRIGYVVLGIGCLVGAAVLIRSALRAA